MMTAIMCLIDLDRDKAPGHKTDVCWVDISFMTDATVVHNTFPVMAAL
jgi:hypothetical protein